MKAIYVCRQSGSGDLHYEVLALFTSDEKLEAFMKKLKEKHPDADFGIYENYDDFVVDPVELSDANKFNELYADIIALPKIEYDACPVCQTLKNKKQKYCSDECFHESSKKFTITENELRHLISTKTYEEIGRMFNVSGNAIKKRCKSLGIKLSPRKKNAGVV